MGTHSIHSSHSTTTSDEQILLYKTPSPSTSLSIIPPPTHQPPPLTSTSPSQTTHTNKQAMADTATAPPPSRYTLPSVPTRSYQTSATTTTPIYTNYAPPPLRSGGQGRSYLTPHDTISIASSNTSSHHKQRRRYDDPLEGADIIHEVVVPKYHGYDAPARVSNLSSDSDEGDDYNNMDQDDVILMNACGGKRELNDEAKRKIKRYQDKLWLAERSPLLAMDIPRIERRIGSVYYKFGHVDEPLVKAYLDHKKKKLERRRK